MQDFATIHSMLEGKLLIEFGNQRSHLVAYHSSSELSRRDLWCALCSFPAGLSLNGLVLLSSSRQRAKPISFETCLISRKDWNLAIHLAELLPTYWLNKKISGWILGFHHLHQPKNIQKPIWKWCPLGVIPPIPNQRSSDDQTQLL